jgi:signal transduction histidine kinase
MGQAPPLRDLSILYMSLGLVLIIVAIDWLLPAGILFGVFLAVPLLLASTSQRTNDVWIVLTVSMIGFVVAAIYGRPPISPPALWLPNRVIALIVIPASGILAAFMQQRRLEAEQARDAAVSAGATNRLLFSLLAHDLRSPLVLSRQMLDYVQQCTDEGLTPDAALLQDVRLRIDRNLRVIDGVLTAARAEIDEDGADVEQSAGPTQVQDEIRQEAGSFEAEAAMRNKKIEVALDDIDRPIALREALVMRQVLAILIDNAIRYADAGVIRISARIVGDSTLALRVTDPGASEASRVQNEGGAGLGLQLCKLLLARAGGGLAVVNSDGSTAVEAVLRLRGTSTDLPPPRA